MIETKPLSSVEIDHARARAELPALSRRVAALVRSVSDGETHIPNSEWRIADAAAHMVCAIDWHIDFARGWHSPIGPADSAAANAAKIAELGERRPDRLAQLYLERVQTYLDVTEGLAADKPVHFHFGVLVTLSMVSCLAMGESMVHTYDIAKAAKKPWRIDPQAAALFMGAIAPMMPFLLLPNKISGLSAAFQFKIRGGPSYVVRIQDGRPGVEAGSKGPVDATISLDPVAAFLLLYGRVTQWSLLSTGKVLVWGRKPLLGMRYGSFQVKP